MAEPIRYYLNYTIDELNSILDKAKNMAEYDDTEIKESIEKKITMPLNEDGSIIFGKKDNILVSDENGILSWKEKGVEIVSLTQEEYDALEAPDENILYIIL